MGLSSGTFTRPNDFTTNASLAIDPTATQFDNEFDDIKAALDIAIYADGQQSITADIPWGGFKITSLGNAAADTDALNRQTADARYLLKAQLAANIAVNASLATAVGSSALTISLKGADGNDPSSSNPVLLPFRSTTATTGSITVRTVTSATSLVISSGSTLDTTNSVAFSIWVVAFDDSGTVRLGAINCLKSDVTDIYPLGRDTTHAISSTAEGGAGAADSSRVFYTGTAVTSQPYVILGRLIYNSGLVTAGTWNATPDVIVNYGPGMKLPGDVVQTVRTVDGAVATGTTALPFDDTIPQSGEGDQYMSRAITPTVAANVLAVEGLGEFASTSTNSQTVAALFQDAVADALAAQFGARNPASGGTAQILVKHVMRAGTTSSTTFKYRAGNTTGTVTFNGQASGRLMGGVMGSYMRVDEIVA